VSYKIRKGEADGQVWAPEGCTTDRTLTDTQCPVGVWKTVLTVPWRSSIDVFASARDGDFAGSLVRVVARSGAARWELFEREIPALSDTARLLSERTIGAEFLDIQVQRIQGATGTLWLSATAYGREPSSDVDISPAEWGEEITPNDAGTELWTTLRVGGGGTLRVTTARGQVINFAGVAAGEWFPLKVRRVWATGTTATNIVGMR